MNGFDIVNKYVFMYLRRVQHRANALYTMTRGLTMPNGVLGDLPAFDVRKEVEYGIQDNNERRRRGDIDAYCMRVANEILEEDAKPGKVISIYGIGGQGKTYVLSKLYIELLRSIHDKGTVVLFHSFEKSETSSTEAILKDIAELAEFNGVPCSSFWMNYYAYRAATSNVLKARREFLDDYEQRRRKGIVDAFVDLSDFCAPFIDFLMNGFELANGSTELSGFPIGSAAASIIERVTKAADEARRREIEAEWVAISSDSDAGVLRRRLMLRLKRDLERWIGTASGNKIVVFLDTFEKLGWGSGGSRSRYEWARKLTRTNGTLWVIAGRMRLPWGNVLQYPIQLVEMTDEEADHLLVACGVADPTLREEIKRLTGCLPIYLRLCADLLEEDPQLSPKDIKALGDREGLPERYLRNLGEKCSRDGVRGVVSGVLGPQPYRETRCSQ